MNPIYFLYNMLIGANNQAPKYNLHKQPTKEDNLLKINRFIEKNFYVISLAFIVLLFLVFIWACFAIVGMSGTESGLTYNHMERII